MGHRVALAAVCGLLASAVLAGDDPVGEIAAEVAGTEGSSYDRAKKLVAWVNDNFEWTATDYRQRSVEEILERRGGNCAEQARLLTALYEAAVIETRWVAEINVHPESERRRNDAAKKIAEKGNRMSVFGFMHNDHRWLEVRDEAGGEWQPSDPTLGVIGLDAWLDARVGFGERPEAAADMLVPFVVVARDGDARVDRSRHYLVDAFDARYGGRLSTLEAWPAWVALVDELSALGAAAFAGEVNLHEHEALIRRYRDTYEALRTQFASVDRSGQAASSGAPGSPANGGRVAFVQDGDPASRHNADVREMPRSGDMNESSRRYGVDAGAGLGGPGG